MNFITALAYELVTYWHVHLAVGAGAALVTVVI